MDDQLTHFDEGGKAIMVEVGDKQATQRLAVARGEVRMQEATLKHILGGEMSKGDVLAVARLAGIMAAKKNARADSPLSSFVADFGGHRIFSPLRRRSHRD